LCNYSKLLSWESKQFLPFFAAEIYAKEVNSLNMNVNNPDFSGLYEFSVSKIGATNQTKIEHLEIFEKFKFRSNLEISVIV